MNRWAAALILTPQGGLSQPSVLYLMEVSPSGIVF
jgi:hypothetical protein